MNPPTGQRGRPHLGAASVLRDPLVPLDFGAWVRCVVGTVRRGWTRLATLALMPVGVAFVYLIWGRLAAPSPGDIQIQVEAALASSPTGTLSSSDRLWIMFGSMIPVAVVCGILGIVATAFYQGASYYLSVRTANGQPTTLAEALSRTAPRTLPFIGWALLAQLAIVLALAIPIALGLPLPDWASRIATFLGLALCVALSVMVHSSLAGVVFIERAGPRRCYALIRGRFWATLGRLAAAALGCLGYVIVVGLLLNLVCAATGVTSTDGTAVVVLGTVMLVLAIPMVVLAVAVTLVTYAELRFHEASAISTRSLAAELSR
jgi:hypothetical protein